ncbi:MAG: 50S ribosomal protein L25 [Candidatus Omnitrophica bacterium]|nr:50S ribosomal protein L25 [Candidatus Omnitrophota bacterium]
MSEEKMTKAKTTKEKTTQVVLTVKKRTTLGKRRVERLRKTGMIPGIVYGKATEPIAIEVNLREFTHLLHARASEHALLTLRLEGASNWEKPALVHVIQHHPVDDHILHVDFHTIVLTERLKVKVPLLLKGEPVGVKQDGGVLEQFLREIEVECLPTQIPAHLEHDIAALKIGDTLHVRELVIPENIKITVEGELAIASVHKPKEERPEEEAAAVTEPEVIREKKAEEGTAAEAATETEAAPKKEDKGS